MKRTWCVVFLLTTACATAPIDTPVAKRPVEPAFDLIIEPSETPQVLKAHETKAHVGERVIVEDVVVAVSSTQKTPGAYFNFGKPYPRQTLSVWMPWDLYQRMPRHLVLRPVRIRGLVNNTDSGPVIDIDDVDQIEFLPVDEAILHTKAFGSPTQRALFTLALRQVAARGDVETIEQLGNDLIVGQKGDRFGYGREAFMDAVCCFKDAFIDRWIAAKPTSPAALLAKVKKHIDKGWRARGGGYANTVTPEGWEVFRRELRRARDVLDDHPELQRLPTALALAFDIALGLDASSSELEAIFTAHINTAPDDVSAYTSAVWALLPRWRGREGEAEAFLQRLARSRGERLYALVALHFQSFGVGSYRQLFGVVDLDWNITAVGLEKLIQDDDVDIRYYRSIYAYMAWKANDKKRTWHGLQLASPDPDFGVWPNIDSLLVAARFARE